MDKIISLADLKPDPKNARKHNPRNIGQITASLQQVGAARSGVIDDDNVILAGNGTYQALVDAGIERVKIVEADGNEWVVVQRKGLTEEQKRILSVSDNRSGELATWHGPTLEEQGIDLQPWFYEGELAGLRHFAENRPPLDFLAAPLHSPMPEPGAAPVGADGAVARPDSLQTIALSYVVTLAQRDLILRAITAAKVRGKVATTNEALLLICERYLSSERV